MSRCHCVLVALALLPLASVRAQDWPHWRGPSFDGSTTVTGLPTSFDKETHVAWSVPMPGPAASTPIVVGKRVFLTAADRERGELLAICLDRATGEVVWQRDAGSGFSGGEDPASKVAGGPRSNYASPSPCTDGERVVFFFGNGDLVAFDYDGKELWRRNLQKDYGKFAFQWTFSASPTLHAGKVWIPILQRDVPVERGRRPRNEDDDAAREAILSFVLAIDAESGATRLKIDRPSPARVESREAYTTIVPWRSKKGVQMLCLGGDVLTGHDPDTGRELWRWGTWNPGHREQWWRVVPSVVVADGLALVCAPKRAPVYAVAIEATVSSEAGVANAASAEPANDSVRQLGDDAVVWKSEGRPNFVSSDVPTPAYHAGAFFVLNDDRATISRVAAKDGSIVWTTQLAKDFRWRASPTVAEGRVYLMDHAGNVVVVDETSGEIVHQAAFGNEGDDLIRSTIVAAHGALWIRTNDKLWCISER
ncbi:MAG: PQQ-binding-like beta-propeller repeat protein [Planctomycetes bacterium]|nr:PQQ-binding-like beta-propeller repeat protein [Planctomycetota bacterium]MCB9890484.1 PQQ-binding-like beta-propeller repeat protein [Planctomycetota bacterium]MCB9917725.1 PQQ-binding-like beta-propeller repeat protein [Planctomycetota bacterium]